VKIYISSKVTKFIRLCFTVRITKDGGDNISLFVGWGWLALLAAALFL
jgi:hypothetical protein